MEGVVHTTVSEAQSLILERKKLRLLLHFQPRSAKMPQEDIVYLSCVSFVSYHMMLTLTKDLIGNRKSRSLPTFTIVLLAAINTQTKVHQQQKVCEKKNTYSFTQQLSSQKRKGTFRQGTCMFMHTQKCLTLNDKKIPFLVTTQI